MRVRGILARVFDPEKLERGFRDHALVQDTRELTFAHGVELRSDVGFRIGPSVGAWDKAHQDEMPGTRQAGYDKLKHRELPTAAGLVAYAGREIGTCLQQRPSPFKGRVFTLQEAFRNHLSVCYLYYPVAMALEQSALVGVGAD